MERQHDSHMQYPFFTLKICIEKKYHRKKKESSKQFQNADFVRAWTEKMNKTDLPYQHIFFHH